MSEKRNIFRYLFWRGDLSFEQDPVNEIDGLIFSALSYANMECASQLSESGCKMTIGMLPDYLRLTEQVQGNYGPMLLEASVKKLVQKLAQAPRYRDLAIRGYKSITDDAAQMQFAAAAFELPDDTVFLAYRGTDQTLVGWKEDLNMSFTQEIPSQIEAQVFADEMIRSSDRHIFLGGHSKGGNLAIWAAAHLKKTAQRRVVHIYNNDGPGFSNRVLESDGYLAIRDKILSYVPESSIVGILMKHDTYVTIKSTNPTIFQHDPFSWCVSANHFDVAKERSEFGQQMDVHLNTWIKSLSKEEREQFVESVWTIVSSSNAKTVNNISDAKLKSALSMQKAFLQMDAAEQKQIFSCLRKMIWPNGEKWESLVDVMFDFKTRKETEDGSEY